METAGEEDWAKQLKAACSLEDSSEVPFSFLCLSSNTLMDCRVSCFLWQKPTHTQRYTSEQDFPLSVRLTLSKEAHTRPGGRRGKEGFGCIYSRPEGFIREGVLAGAVKSGLKVKSNFGPHWFQFSHLPRSY